METVVIRVLGPITATVDGRPVDLGGPQQRAVLACLVMHLGSVVDPTTLIDRLWPDDPPASATKLVQKHISGLRSALGRSAIETAGGGYRLAVDPEQVDVARFERTVAGEEGETSPSAHAELAWRGSPYGGCGELPFVLSERDRLTRLHLEVRLDRLAAQLERRAFGPALAELERLAVEHPEHERIVALLMRGLYASDRQVEALRAARRHEQHLREELGVEPSPELRELERRVLDHDDSLRIPGTATTVTADETATTATTVPADDRIELPAAVEPDDEGRQPADPIEEVRPVVVVLASETVDDAGPEDLRRRQEQLVEDVARLADRFGGHLERTVGHESIVLFGVPARGDDLARATALGEALVETRQTASVVIVAGEAVVAVEPTVRLLAGSLLAGARRLAAGAPPGTITTGGTVDQPPSTEVPMAGRDDELDRIAEVWRRVADDGRLRMVEIVGDAGIGKTRLLRDVTARLDPRPHRVIEVGHSSYGDGLLFAALRQILFDLSLGSDDHEAWLLDLGLPEPSAQRLAGRLRPLLEPVAAVGPDGPDDWIGPIVELLDAVAARGQLVLVVEDVHWAAPETILGLTEAIADLADRRILVLVTRRDEPPSPGLDSRGIAERIHLKLDPLPASALTELADRAGTDLAPEIVRRIVDRSGGNPLFLLQWLQMLDERPDVAGDLADDVAPASVRLVIAARLDHLAPPLRAAVQVAALVPHRLTAAVLAPIAERSEREIAAALQVLARVGLLRRDRRATKDDEPIFEFTHSLVADVAAGQLTRPRRLELHRRAAGALTASTGNSVEALQDIAWHWQQVLDLSAAEETALDQTARAAARDAFARAGTSLLQVDAGRSTSLLRRAVELSDEGSASRAALLLQLGAISTDAGHFDEARTSLTEAAAIFDELGDPAAAGEALARQARSLWYLGQGDDIDRLLAESSRRLALAPPSPAHAHAHVVIASQTAIRGRPAEALAIADRVRPLVEEHGTPEDSIRLLHGRGQARFDLDDSGGLEDLEEALRRSLDHGLGRLTSQSFNNLAEVVWVVRGPVEATRLATEGLTRAIEGGYLGQAPWHIAQRCELGYDLGRWDDVLEAANTELALTPAVAWLLDAYGARVRFWRGDDAAIVQLDGALDATRVTKERQLLVPMLSAAIAAKAHLGQVDEAAALGEELRTFARGHGHHQLRDAGDAARGLCRIGRPDLALDLLPDRRPTILRRRLMWETAQGTIAEAEHRWEQARPHYERAVAGWAAFPHPFEAANAEAGRLRTSRRLGLAPDDVDPIERAATKGFASLGAHRLLDDAETLEQDGRA